MKKASVYIIVTAALNLVLRLVMKNSVALSEWYALYIYPIFVNIVARVSGFFPFSVIEIVVFALILTIIAGVIVFVIRLIKRGGRKELLLRLLVTVLSTVSTVAIVFLLFCEINYNRMPFSYYSGLTVEGHTKSELQAVITEINQQLEKLEKEIAVREDGGFRLSVNVGDTSRTAMESLSSRYQCLQTYYPRPKPLLTSRLYLSNATLCGVFSPFTMEANYNADMPDSEQPFTVCHELSHLSGFMREDEANFVAFLACRDSGEADFAYSGYVRALAYCLNAYYPVATEDEYTLLYLSIPAQVRRELTLVNDYWKPYRKTKLSEIATEVNDSYLRSNGQEDGVKSYGRFVDLLIAEYFSKGE